MLVAGNASAGNVEFALDFFDASANSVGIITTQFDLPDPYASIVPFSALVSADTVFDGVAYPNDTLDIIDQGALEQGQIEYVLAQQTAYAFEQRGDLWLLTNPSYNVLELTEQDSFGLPQDILALSANYQLPDASGTYVYTEASERARQTSNVCTADA
jgi:hypothetical protein